MPDEMTFPKTFDEFAERYKIVDKEEVYTNGAELIPIFRVRQWLENQSNADVVEVRHGEWMKPLGDNGSGWNCGGVIKQILGCSCCGHFYQNGPYNYCPNCGAKMDGEDVTDNAD